ncbi:hypothetical protein ABFG93_21005 [Pseudalkalibacillus hwajinpoensis]|uniref:hypothetical protein n=1 Tax=Guptibacillus hwajinpoensis TaxID=208199 RepID=UPI00325AED48
MSKEIVVEGVKIDKEQAMLLQIAGMSTDKIVEWFREKQERKASEVEKQTNKYTEFYGAKVSSLKESKPNRNARVTLFNGKTIEVDALEFNYRPLREHVTANSDKYLFVGGTYVNKDAIASFVDADEEEVDKAIDEERKDQAKYEEEAEKLAESVFKENEHKFKDYGKGFYREV